MRRARQLSNIAAQDKIQAPQQDMKGASQSGLCVTDCLSCLMFCQTTPHSIIEHHLRFPTSFTSPCLLPQHFIWNIFRLMFEEFYSGHPDVRNLNSITNIVLYLFYYISTHPISLHLCPSEEIAVTSTFPPKHLSMYVH